ncbi:group II intron reverse transcriptase/maturase, partial [Pseudomonas aeruginosa]
MIFLALWRWAKRRHPKKTLQWIGAKYFKPMKGRKGVFATATMNDKGEMRTIELYSLASTPIERHKKVSGEYNPFDPAMEAIGEKLRTERMLKKLKYRTQIRNLYLSQKGLCSLCN